MTYFGHFNYWLLFLNLKLRCPGIGKKEETYVTGGGGVQRIYIFLETAPGLYKTQQNTFTIGDYFKYY